MSANVGRFALEGAKYALFALALILFYSCSDDDNGGGPKQTDPEAKIMILSDPHVYDPTMGTSGAAFDEYVAHDRKLIAESAAINESVVDMILEEAPDILLVAGDMTKDGAMQSHRLFVDDITELKNAGIKVYVVPGNHDVNNHHAYGYSGETATPVDFADANEFAQLYADYGYGDNLYDDPNSLSYVVEPVDGLWIIGMDACRYAENTTEKTVTGGKFSQATLDWIVARTEEGVAAGKIVVGVMHHGIMEHFPGMSLLFADYIVEDYANVNQTLGKAGMHVVFTGHHHAHDMHFESFGDGGVQKNIFDVQTGSTVTWTCPLRIVELTKDKKMTFKTEVVSTIDFDLGGLAFQDYAYDFLESGLPALIVHELGKLGVDEQSAQALVPLVSPTMIAYYHGDESSMQNAQVLAGINQMAQSGDQQQVMLANILLGIWNDPTPDREFTIDLETGTLTP